MRAGRAVSHHTPDHAPKHERPPVVVGDPVLRHDRTARRFGADHNSLNGPARERSAPANDLFHESENRRHRGPSPEGHRK